MTEPPDQTPGERREEIIAALQVPAPTGALSELMPDGGEVQVINSGWRLTLREFASNRLALVGVVVIVFFILLCFLGPVVYHTNQTLTNPLSTYSPPGGSNPLGTDENGFDELGRIMVGGRAALEIGAFSTVVALLVGTLYGAISGLAGGFVDGILMRFVDILLSIPFLFIVLVLATKYNGTVTNLSLVLGIFSWLVPARLVRWRGAHAPHPRLRARRPDHGSDARTPDLPAPDPQRDVGHDRQRHVPDRRRDPRAGFARFPRLWPCLSGHLLGRHAGATRRRMCRTATGGWSIP